MGKVCFKCGVFKPLTDFYAHPQMADGRVGKCKECNKADVQANYRANREHYIEYEHQRFQDPARKAKIVGYQQTTRANDPQKYRARYTTTNAVRDGRLIKQPCEICGEFPAEAHHHDYSTPLDVHWLCRAHHLEHHGKQAY